MSINRASTAEKKQAAAKGKEQRRRNSFMQHMSKYIRNEENDIQMLFKLCKSERDAALLKLQSNNRDASMFLLQSDTNLSIRFLIINVLILRDVADCGCCGMR